MLQLMSTRWVIIQSSDGNHSEEQLAPKVSLWQRFINWLTEPIQFPGKTYDIGPSDAMYNNEKEKPWGEHGRRTSEPR